MNVLMGTSFSGFWQQKLIFKANTKVLKNKRYFEILSREQRVDQVEFQKFGTSVKYYIWNFRKSAE